MGDGMRCLLLEERLGLGPKGAIRDSGEEAPRGPNEERLDDGRQRRDGLEERRRPDACRMPDPWEVGQLRFEGEPRTPGPHPDAQRFPPPPLSKPPSSYFGQVRGPPFMPLPTSELSCDELRHGLSCPPSIAADDLDELWR
jgi:hypothetical protein